MTEPFDELCRRAVDLLGAGGLAPARIRVQAGDHCVEVDWRPMAGAPAASPAPAAAPPPAPAPEPVADGAEAPGTFRVCSPMVGTFYRAAAPGENPLVAVGDPVEPGRQLAILEAMKLMNPLTAERPGRVIEVLAGDGCFVEYDQPLFLMAETAG
jgi:acetyl-CoA carboxylase biotin carboxyl carrier protein